MTITNKAVQHIRTNSKAHGLLMAIFHKSQNTIISWIESKDIRLTTPDAVRIIAEETGLSPEDILEESESVKVQPAGA